MWTCDRCGRTATVKKDRQPKNWCRVFFATPPHNALSEGIGDLCNPCGGRLVDFIQGRDKEAAEQDRKVADIIERAS